MSNSSVAGQVADIVAAAKARDPSQPEFFQAVDEVLESVMPLLEARPEFVDVLGRMLEPERVLSFRVAWTDDAGVEQVNRGYRVVMSTACGPGKGGLRFHPSVTLSMLKFLAFEQVFKNALTTLPLGGAKGGSDFNPKGKSDGEVMRFCQAFMTALYGAIGPDTDIPAGDIGVGGREIGYLYGQYKRLTRRADGAVTGKGLKWGGSLVRTEATGYGLVYFASHVVGDSADGTLAGAVCAVSGSGNVALHATEKLLALGATVVTLSDSSGVVTKASGFSEEDLAVVKEIKLGQRGRVSAVADAIEGAEFTAGGNPWSTKVDYAFPCATQNEMNGDDVRALASNGCKGVFEGANMPLTADALEAVKEAGLLYSPGKASNAGGVAVSGLEMAQNAGHVYWTAEEVDAKLQAIMKDIYTAAKTTAEAHGVAGNIQAGANMAGFAQVADAVIAQGVW